MNNKATHLGRSQVDIVFILFFAVNPAEKAIFASSAFVSRNRDF